MQILVWYKNEVWLLTGSRSCRIREFWKAALGSQLSAYYITGSLLSVFLILSLFSSGARKPHEYILTSFYTAKVTSIRRHVIDDQ